MMEFLTEIESSIEKDDAAKIEDRLLFYSLVRSIKPEVCVEIGTHKGLTALYIAQALKDNGTGMLHTCDPSDFGAQSNIAKFPELAEYITQYRIKGEDLDIDNIDFLFVDGYHEEYWVTNEIKHYFPRLSKKAVVMFHDSGGDNEFVGVNAAIEKSGIKTILLPTATRMHLYSTFTL